MTLEYWYHRKEGSRQLPNQQLSTAKYQTYETRWQKEEVKYCRYPRVATFVRRGRTVDAVSLCFLGCVAALAKQPFSLGAAAVKVAHLEPDEQKGDLFPSRVRRNHEHVPMRDEVTKSGSGRALRVQEDHGDDSNESMESDHNPVVDAVEAPAREWLLALGAAPASEGESRSSAAFMGPHLISDLGVEGRDHAAVVLALPYAAEMATGPEAGFSGPDAITSANRGQAITLHVDDGAERARATDAGVVTRTPVIKHPSTAAQALGTMGTGDGGKNKDEGRQAVDEENKTLVKSKHRFHKNGSERVLEKSVRAHQGRISKEASTESMNLQVRKEIHELQQVDEGRQAQSSDLRTGKAALGRLANGAEAASERQDDNLRLQERNVTGLNAAGAINGGEGMSEGEHELGREVPDEGNLESWNLNQSVSPEKRHIDEDEIEIEHPRGDWLKGYEGEKHKDGGEDSSEHEEGSSSGEDRGKAKWEEQVPLLVHETDTMKEDESKRTTDIASSNKTEILEGVQTGLNDIRTIETEMEKRVEGLLGLFPSDEGETAEGVILEADKVRHEVAVIHEELVKLRKTVNSTTDGVRGAQNEVQHQNEVLAELRSIKDAEGAWQLIGGNVKVDYTTGQIRWDTPEKGKDPVKKAGSNVIPDAGEQSTEEADPLQGKDEINWKEFIEKKKESIEKRKDDFDPAKLHLDPELLRDFVILSMSAALGGVAAAGFGLPEILGYILGGMLVGPGGADVIREVNQVETFAQFGSIFLLFGHGLRYSSFLHVGGAHSTAYAPQGRMGAFTVLFVVFSALLVGAAMLGVQNFGESIFLSAAATLSSTAMVTDFVSHSRLADTVFARMVIDLVSVQDLVMCPLLAIPTAIMYAFQEYEANMLVFPRVTACALLLLACVLASRRVLPSVMQLLVLKDKEKEQSSGLFTLGMVSYCLGVALLCERLNLSHEAGALFAGLLMVDSPFAKKAHACMHPLRSLFGCIYLGSLGMIVNSRFILNNFGDILACVFLLALIKFVIVAMVMKSFGFSCEASTLAGACMAQVSEISLFFMGKAQHLGLIVRHHYLMAVASTITLMIVSPLIIKGLQRFSRLSNGSLVGEMIGVGHDSMLMSPRTALEEGGFNGATSGGRAPGWLSPARLSVQTGFKKREDNNGFGNDREAPRHRWFSERRDKVPRPVTPNSAADGSATRRRLQIV